MQIPLITNSKSFTSLFALSKWSETSRNDVVLHGVISKPLLVFVLLWRWNKSIEEYKRFYFIWNDEHLFAYIADFDIKNLPVFSLNNNDQPILTISQYSYKNSGLYSARIHPEVYNRILSAKITF